MLKIYIKIFLFVIYPVVTYFLIIRNITSVIIGLSLAIFTNFVIFLIEKKQKSQVAILDLSSISDERITDFINYSFFSKIILPKFIIDESDKLLKTGNNRNLDNNIRKLKENNKVVISYKNYTDIKETDFKIIRLAKYFKAKIITTDFNLKKIATIHGIKVVNINDLYECLKPIILPGYKISVFLAKEGKEKNQAIGFFDDGTTVVAENGRTFIGKKVNLTITSILQTSSNKMLFGQISQDDFIEDSIRK